MSFLVLNFVSFVILFLRHPTQTLSYNTCTIILYSQPDYAMVSRLDTNVNSCGL